MNPRRTKPPETVFETAAFDRSATPPDDEEYRSPSRFPDASLGVRRPVGQCLRHPALRPERVQRREGCPEPGSAGREGTPVREARAEKEGFEPSKEEMSPLTP